jgi:hypothetical protein
MGFNAMKLNPEYRMFDANMFLQLRATLEGIVAPTGMVNRRFRAGPY